MRQKVEVAHGGFPFDKQAFCQCLFPGLHRVERQERSHWHCIDWKEWLELRRVFHKWVLQKVFTCGIASVLNWVDLRDLMPLRVRQSAQHVGRHREPRDKEATKASLVRLGAGVILICG